MTTIGTLGIQNVLTGGMPCEGAKVLPYVMDFSAASQYDFDLTGQYQGNQFTTLQCAYIDNSANGSSLTISMNVTNQTIVVPKNSCGYFTLVMPAPPKLSVTTAGLVKVYMALMNFYIPPTVWSV